VPSIAGQTCPEGDCGHSHLAPVFAARAKCLDGVRGLSVLEIERRRFGGCTGANGSWEWL